MEAALSTTRAAVLRQLGRPVSIEELSVAEPAAGEVRVRLTAAGVCHSDLYVRDGAWARPTPVVMGHEGAGVVETVGEGVDPALVGRQVVLSWQVPCGTCRACADARPWACQQSPSFSHLRRDGSAAYADTRGQPVHSYCALATMSEATVVAAAAAVPIGDDVDPGVAALIGCCVSTGVGAVRKTAQVAAGSSVVIIGLGGVGLSCVMGAKLAQVGRIVVVDIQPSKLDLALDLGATHAVTADADGAATLRAILAQLPADGADYSFEAAGRAETAMLAVDALAPDGLAVMVGMPPMGARASFDVYRLVDGNRRIVGSNYGHSDPAVDFPACADLFRAGRLPVERLIDHRLDLAELEDAFDRLRAGRALRQVVVMPGG
jgi:S-(hydroxymethyl)glutathione dehydrogenase / alcohol dehydrogenase